MNGHFILHHIHSLHLNALRIAFCVTFRSLLGLQEDIPFVAVLCQPVLVLGPLPVGGGGSSGCCRPRGNCPHTPQDQAAASVMELFSQWDCKGFTSLHQGNVVTREASGGKAAAFSSFFFFSPQVIVNRAPISSMEKLNFNLQFTSRGFSITLRLPTRHPVMLLSFGLL